MQHHGAPTRLLDFTYSIYVATYFAVEEAEGDSVVWAIDGPWALQRSAALLRSAGKRGTRKMLKPFMDEDEKVAHPLFMSKPYVAAAWPINPFRLNERLRVQQGAFLIQGDISKPFTENLGALSRGPRDGQDSKDCGSRVAAARGIEASVVDGYFSGSAVPRAGRIRKIARHQPLVVQTCALG